LNVKRLGLFVFLFAAGFLSFLALRSVAQANKIDPGEFDAPVLIHFETAPPGAIGSLYSALGVSFEHLSAGPTFNTGTGNGASKVACNASPFPPGPAELLFDSAIDRAGFYITADNNSTTTVTAYTDGTQVGSEAFATGGEGGGGSFIGVEFSSPFDRVVISIQSVKSGVFCIDDLRFEGKHTKPTTEPTREPTAQPTAPPTKEPPPQPTATATPEIIIISPPNTGTGGIK
jgi:hypothetical protein